MLWTRTAVEPGSWVASMDECRSVCCWWRWWITGSISRWSHSFSSAALLFKCKESTALLFSSVGISPSSVWEMLMKQTWQNTNSSSNSKLHLYIHWKPTFELYLLVHRGMSPRARRLHRHVEIVMWRRWTVVVAADCWTLLQSSSVSVTDVDLIGQLHSDSLSVSNKAFTFKKTFTENTNNTWYYLLYIIIIYSYLFFNEDDNQLELESLNLHQALQIYLKISTFYE